MIDEKRLSFSSFDPREIDWQWLALKQIEGANYDSGVQEFLLSGAVGSAKTTLASHIAIKHCLKFNHAKLLVGRQTLPDLKETIFESICSQLLNDETIIEGVHYKIVTTRAHIYFKNGSKIISGYWRDKRYKKFRSLDLTGAIIEELTENNEQEMEAYKEIKNRIGRRKTIREKFLISLTNPDSPKHWAYKYFISNPSKDRHVIYSKTADNKFLPESYIEQLKRDLDPKMARRMLYGEWVEIDSEGIYHQYSTSKHMIDKDYIIDRKAPICISFDFNIADGKPYSVLISQFRKFNGKTYFNCFDEVIIYTARTESIMEEIAARGYFDQGLQINVYGDATTGNNRSTSSNRSDYEIIRHFLSNYKDNSGRPISFVFKVPISNPDVRKRHNTVNAYLLNTLGEIRINLYKKCQVLDEGLRLTDFKKGSQAIENDNNRWQHITTALGYMVCREDSDNKYIKMEQIDR
jgi:hypothetical protein